MTVRFSDFNQWPLWDSNPHALWATDFESAGRQSQPSYDSDSYGDNSKTASEVGSGITPPLKWHGGKQYLASRIIALMPAHTHYVEPFFGGGSVLLAKDPSGVSEVANDINGNLCNFWWVLQDADCFAAFKRRVEATPFSEREYKDAAREESEDAVARATAFFIRCRQSLAGRMDSFSPISRTRTRRGMNEQASAWLNAIAGLPIVHARLSRVVILNRPAIDCIQSQDGTATLFYCDPPYLHATRSSPHVYDHEMTGADHRELLSAIIQCKGKVMLSGYDSPLYAEALRSWTRHVFDLPNNSAGGKSKRRMQEIVWTNF